MNGYVNAFVIVRSFKDGLLISVEAEVTVSESRIRSFIESTATGVARTSSDSLLADVTREIDARRARSELYKSLFSDFPSNALSSHIVRLAPSEVDPSKVDVWFEARYDKAFLKTVRDSIASIQRTNSKQESASPSTPNQAVVCFSRDVGDSIEEPSRLFRRQTSVGGNEVGVAGRNTVINGLFQRQIAVHNMQPSGCVAIGEIDPGALELAGKQQGSRLPGYFGYGLLSLAQGFGGDGSPTEMSIQNFDKLEAFVISRNAGSTK